MTKPKTMSKSARSHRSGQSGPGKEGAGRKAGAERGGRSADAAKDPATRSNGNARDADRNEAGKGGRGLAASSNYPAPVAKRGSISDSEAERAVRWYLAAHSG